MEKYLASKNSKDSKDQTRSQCLKITEKVSFNIESEASYIYILKGKNGQLWKSEVCGQTVLPDLSLVIGQKFWNFKKFKQKKYDINAMNLDIFIAHEIAAFYA